MSQKKKLGKSKSWTPKQSTRWKFLLAGVFLFIGALSAWLFYNRVVIADVDYEPCQASYGEVVHEWRGSGESRWNDKDYFYQTRSFSIIAHAPDVRLPNTAELEPHRIATGGDNVCLEGFDETIDITSEYRWEGSRPDDISFGVLYQDEDVKTLLNNTFTSDSDYREDLSTPVYGQPEQAAVWVDDGAEALVSSGRNQNEYKRLLCINFRGCGDITEQYSGGKPVRGSGFQYVTGNCPNEMECAGDWYEQSVFESFKQENLLKPFKLRLSAVSTFASTAGTEVLLTFRHPARVDLVADTGSGTSKALAGQTIYEQVDLSKTGPRVDGLTLKTESDSITGIGFKGDMNKSLNKLNSHDSVALTMELNTAANLPAGECYEDDIELIAEYNGKTATEKATVSYCIQQPVKTYTYTIKTKGETETDTSVFTSQATETLNDGRGWPRANVAFENVNGNSDFILWLATPEEVTSFSSGCSAEYSCRVGDNVIINDERWQNATSSWNEAGGSIRDYRHMVINHEVGHLLGRGHIGCPGSGQQAPVMQQQSIDLEGCRFNPWPLQFEIDAV